MNKSPAGRLSWSAIKTSIIDGGIMIPRQPDAATVPVASSLE